MEVEAPDAIIACPLEVLAEEVLIHGDLLGSAEDPALKCLPMLPLGLDGLSSTVSHATPGSSAVPMLLGEALPSPR